MGDGKTGAEAPTIGVDAILSDKQLMSDSDYDTHCELLIVYATETGNARDAADFVARQCRRIAFRCRVMNSDAISLVGHSFSVSRSSDNTYSPTCSQKTLSSF